MAEATMNAEKVVELVRKTASAQVDAAVKLEHKAVAGMKRAAKTGVKLAKENPLATAGVSSAPAPCSVRSPTRSSLRSRPCATR